MKVLAKLGLVTAAAATVLFIFIYEFQGPVINRVMSQPPSETSNVKPIKKVQEMPAKVTSDIELPTPLSKITEEPSKKQQLSLNNQWQLNRNNQQALPDASTVRSHCLHQANTWPELILWLRELLLPKFQTPPGDILSRSLITPGS